MEDGTSTRPVMGRDTNETKAGGEISAYAFGSVLLRRSRFILVSMVVGGLIAGGSALIGPAKFKSTAAFLPQGADAARGGLAGLAGQLGVSIPTSGQGPFYVELLGSPELLAPIVHDKMAVPEIGKTDVTLLELFEIEEGTPGHREMQAVNRLKAAVVASDSRTGVVRMSVTTPWASASKRIAEQLLKRLNDFNLKTRQSQAGEERRFAGERLAETRGTLRAAEEALKRFLQNNRQFELSPNLRFEHDRLQRETALQQVVLTNLATAYEEARTREVRDTPVLTVIEPPRLPTVAEPTLWWLRAFLGMLAGALLSAFIALAGYATSRRREAGDPEAVEFLELLSSFRSFRSDRASRGTGPREHA